jgi:hypothetical protein
MVPFLSIAEKTNLILYIYPKYEKYKQNAVVCINKMFIFGMVILQKSSPAAFHCV